MRLQYPSGSSPSRLHLACLSLAFALTACGGGTSNTSGTAPDTSASSPAPAPASAPTQGGGTVTRQALTDIVVDSTAAAAQNNTPLTFGQVFAVGAVPASARLSAVRSDGTAVPLQMDVKATHADGSVRHAVLSAVLPRLAQGESLPLVLSTEPAGAGNAAPQTVQALLGAGFKAAVAIDLDGQTYRASADELLAAGHHTTWLSGPLVSEWLVSAPLKTASGTVHPHLTARFAVRSYAGLSKARVDVTVENDWAYEPGPRNFTYGARIDVSGAPTFSQTALTHFHHGRWRKLVWWGGEPQLHLRHNAAYLMASKALPNYDPAIVVSTDALSALATQWTGADKRPMAPGIIMTAMGTTGGRPDIGPLPQWSALYLLSMDSRAKAVTLGTGDLAGSWPIHFRDKLSDLPVTLKDFPYMTLLGHAGDTVNPVSKKSEAFPVCTECTTAPYNYQPDTPHEPSMAYLPYLVTGDHFYLEELHFWANFNVLQANPYYRQFDKGLVLWNQVRGQAWALRTLGQAAYVTPDSHPLKSYFTNIVANNLAWYNTTYTKGNPNALGILDGSGKYAFPAIAYKTPAGASTGTAPWQDDFFTWSVGHLAELGFAEARPLLAWKAKFPVGRMTTPGHCWVDGAIYALTVRPNATAPLYATLAEAYQASLQGTDAQGQPIPLVNSTGAKYVDQACGSSAQAAWRTQADIDAHTPRGPWLAGEMTGYASSTAGFPSNMQPALAVSADSGIPQAKAAWTVFMNRSVKPDYGTAPQWAIVPRN